MKIDSKFETAFENVLPIEINVVSSSMNLGEFPVQIVVRIYFGRPDAYRPYIYRKFGNN